MFYVKKMVTLPESQNEIIKFSKDNIHTHLSVVNDALSKNTYISGSKLTIADPYLFTVLGWCKSNVSV